MSDELHDIAFTLNGEPVAATRCQRASILPIFLRQRSALTGTHIGCEHGVCGACNVVIDGRSARSCLMLAVQADGASGRDHRRADGRAARSPTCRRSSSRRNALQCGYCTPGILATADRNADARASPRGRRFATALSGNYCRCTGYHAIVDAIEAVIDKRRGAAS